MVEVRVAEVRVAKVRAEEFRVAEVRAESYGGIWVTRSSGGAV